jgi:uncharacterized protein YcfL
MKLFSVFLFFITLQSCTIHSIGKKEKDSLYINTSIPAHTSLTIASEDASLFSMDAVEKSNTILKIHNGTQNINMEKNKIYTLKIAQNSSVIFQNSSYQPASIRLRVYNHSAKIIQKTGQAQ